MKSTLSYKLLRKLNVTTAIGLVVLTAGVSSTGLFAASTSNFAQTINPGSLSIDIVTSGYVPVGSPSVVMTAAPFSFACQTATGTFGAAEQLIYVKNPDASDTGWSVSLAASAPTAVWDGAVSDYDFNDPGTAGCVDDGATTDADAFSGQMTVNPSGGTLASGACASCTTTSVTKGSSNAYVEGSVNSITVVSGAAGSDDIGDWKLSGVSISQKIPKEQAAASDYDINMTLSVVAV